VIWITSLPQFWPLADKLETFLIGWPLILFLRCREIAAKEVAAEQETSRKKVTWKFTIYFLEGQAAGRPVKLTWTWNVRRAQKYCHPNPNIVGARISHFSKQTCTFTFMHSADAFDLHCISIYTFTFLSVLAFLGSQSMTLVLQAPTLFFLNYRKATNSFTINY